MLMHPTIYEPREDSEMLAKHVPSYAQGAVLEIGTGSGILAQEALETADEVIAADINPEAVKHCRKTIKDKKARFITSDLFSVVPAKKFDLIIFNPPYLPQDEGMDDKSLYGGKKGYETVERFLNQATGYLKTEGKVLLLFSELTGKAKVDEIIMENCLSSRKLDERSIFFEKLYVYLIERSVLLKELESRGYKEVKYLAKGRRGVIYTCYKGRTRYTVKSRNMRSKVFGRIEHEGLWLKELNKRGIGPELVGMGRGYIIYRYVEGVFFDEYIQKKSKRQIKEIILDIFRQARELDRMGIDKEEMHRLTKNLLIGEKAVLIDFERTRKTDKPRNVTQACQFFTSTNIALMLREKGIHLDKRQMISLASGYKKDYNEKSFRLILDHIRSA